MRRKTLTDNQRSALARKIQKINNNLMRVRAELSNAYLEMEDEIDALIVGSIANENVCLVGPAGEGKSALTNSFTSLLGATYFSRQLNAYTQPDDLLGSESLREKIDNDATVVKTTNMAPEADIVYLDECFKANPAMMNSLLMFLNERKVDVGEGKIVDCKNRMVIGSSNEYPEDEDLKAFWDRWLIRIRVEKLKRDSSFDSLWTKYNDGSIGVVDLKKSMPIEEIDTLRNSIPHVDLSSLQQSIQSLRLELQKKGIELSSRRWIKVFKILAAVALKNGRLHSAKRDMKFLNNCIWHTESQKEIVEECILECIDRDLKEAQSLQSLMDRLFIEATSSNVNKEIAMVFYSSKLTEANQLIDRASQIDRSDDEVDAILDDIHSKRDRIYNIVVKAVDESSRA